MPRFYSLIPLACSTAAALSIPTPHPPSPFFFPINKHKGQRNQHPPMPGQRQRERDSVTTRFVAGVTDTQLMIKQKKSQISRGGEEALGAGGGIKGCVFDSGGLFQTTPRTPCAFFSSLIHIQAGGGSSPGPELLQHSLKFHTLKHKKEKKKKMKNLICC